MLSFCFHLFELNLSANLTHSDSCLKWLIYLISIELFNILIWGAQAACANVQLYELVVGGSI